MDTTTLAHVPILFALLSAYRSMTESEWEPVAEAGVWRMRRWRGGRYEYRDCTPAEAQEANWDSAMK